MKLNRQNNTHNLKFITSVYLIYNEAFTKYNIHAFPSQCTRIVLFLFKVLVYSWV